MGLLNSVAAQGRGGDTRLAHLTPGEVVIPREVAALRPDLVEHIGAQVRKMGGNPGTLTVGRGRVNPQTGIEEFATEAEVTAAYQSTLGRAPEPEGLAYWMGQSDLSGFKTIAAPEVASNIASIYQSSFGRDAETSGADHWAAQVNNGSIGTVADLTSTIRASAAGDDRVALADKASYPTSWRSEIDENKDQLWYDSAKNQWNPVAIKKTPTATNFSAPSAGAPATANPYTPLIQPVDQNGLVRNQMSGLLSSDSKHMQSARLRAMQQGAQSGTLNSSLQATAGEKAASDAALQIAVPDAATYTQQHLTNQAATNTAGQFNTNWSNDFIKLQQQQTNALQSAAFDADLRGTLQEQLNTFNAEQNRLAREATSANATTSATNNEAATVTATLAGLSSKLTSDINNISASNNIETSAKAVMINNAIEGYKGQQEALRGRAIALGFNPGTYFNFESLRPAGRTAAKTDATATTAPATTAAKNSLLGIMGSGPAEGG